MSRSSRRKMWMGPRGREQWVPATKPGDFSRVGSRTKDDYINGGAGIRGSKDGHKEYNFAWSSVAPNEIQPVLDMAEGLYDTGIGLDLIYFIDPTVYTQNVLAGMYASPYKTGLDGVPLTTDANGYFVYPDLVATEPNRLNYPARSARYRLGPGVTSSAIYVPIPEGKVLWFGVHGVDNGVALGVTPVDGDARGSITVPAMLDVTDEMRCNHSVASSDTVSGVEISLIRRSSGSGSVFSDFAGIMVQMLNPGEIPFPGRFISGRGNSGCEFDGIPTESPYRGGTQIGVSARLVETGAWA